MAKQTKELEPQELLHQEFSHRIPAPAELVRQLPDDLQRDGMTELAARLLLNRVKVGFRRRRG